MLARRWESTLLVNVDNSTLQRLMNNKAAIDALMSIEGFRNLNQDIETIINKSEAVKKARKEANDKDLSAKKKKKLSEEEFRSIQRSSDVNEEIIRLLHYIDEITPLLRSNISVGKKIDFIAQEMQRETNTIGSKLQDKVVSNAVIALKSKIEKIREQAQNIE